MQENEKKPAGDNKMDWVDIFDLIESAAKIKSGQTMASEAIAELSREVKMKEFDMAILGLFAGAVIAGLLFVNHSHALASERNNQRWIEYISQYDFVSQDGEGYNYYNSDVEGDVVNGSENPQKEEQEQR